jgi:hypothetical protein
MILCAILIVQPLDAINVRENYGGLVFQFVISAWLALTFSDEEKQLTATCRVTLNQQHRLDLGPKEIPLTEQGLSPPTSGSKHSVNGLPTSVAASQVLFLPPV